MWSGRLWRHRGRRGWRHWQITASSRSYVTTAKRPVQVTPPVTWTLQPEYRRRREKFPTVRALRRNLAWCSRVAICGISSTVSTRKWLSQSRAGSWWHQTALFTCIIYIIHNIIRCLFVLKSKIKITVYTLYILVSASGRSAISC